MRDYTGLYGIMWDCMGLCGFICDNMNYLNWIMRDYMGLYGITYMGLYGIMRLFGVKWDYMRLHGIKWD